jgi:serine/threonine-protein kinase ULK/ATG1
MGYEKISPHLLGRSPPTGLYSPYPDYPSDVASNFGVITDGKSSSPLDEDGKAVLFIEESATMSDVVYGFAEVKYRQLIPSSPLTTHGSSAKVTDEDSLTIDARVELSEEALVLYVKALSLLAKSMDAAGAWWAHRNSGEVVGGSPRQGSKPSSSVAGNRINSAVQWVRSRFNVTLEKAEVCRLKLVEAQKQLPVDHAGHPSNRPTSSGGSVGAFLTTGITAEKLMYDRALEMSRSAAINEISNTDLAGCEMSYVTAMRMLEAVLERDEVGQEKPAAAKADEGVAGINLEDRAAVRGGESSVCAGVLTA